MLEQKEKYKIIVMLILLAGACFLTYYFHAILETGMVFTHFFYIPVILAALWWRRKGLVVAIFLAALLIFSHIFVRADMVSANDYLRAFMFIVIAFVVATLSEMIAKAHEKTAHLNAILSAIRNVNQLIAREKDRDRLIQKACKNLIETRGYYSAWIALVDENGRFLTAVEAGLGESFVPVVEMMKRGEFTRCGQNALKQSGVKVVEDVAADCADCPLVGTYSGRAGMAIRLEYRDRIYGILSVSIPAEMDADADEQSLFNEVAGDIALALRDMEQEEELRKHRDHLEKLVEERTQALREREHDLNERVKELDCLYGISGLVEKPGISLEEILREGLDFIPIAFQYPEITCARVILESQEFKTENFRETVWKLSSDIVVHGERIGALEVCLLEEKPEADEGSFLKEEKSMVNAIAGQLGHIIDRRRAEEREREAIAAAAAAQMSIDTVEAMGDGVFLITMDGKITSVNPSFERMTGYETSELVEQSMAEMIPKWFKPEDIEKTMGVWKIISEGKSPVPEALTWITKDGREVPTIFTVSFIRDAEDNPTTIVITIKNITELKRAEEALRESEQWLSTTLRSIGDAVIATDAQGLVTLMNHVAEDLTGWDEAKAVGKPLEDVFNIINEQTGERAENPVARVLREGVVVGLANHTVLIARDGTKRPIADSGAPMRDEGGNVIGTVMVFRDVTESKRAEEKLRLFSHSADSSIDGVAIGNLEGRITYVNETFCRMFGYSREELIGKEIPFIYPEDQMPKLKEALKTTMEGGWTGELIGKRKDGELFPMAVTSSRVLDDEGKVIAVMASHRDITERKRMEEELVRKEKLATIGQLASGVGHELRNPLGVIGNSAYYLNMKLKDADEKVRKHIEIQQREVHRANRIISDLLDFSRVRPPSLEKGDVNGIIKDTLADIKLPENISVETHLNDELPGILVDPDQIRQVFLNLISNAVQAMPEGGRLDINTGVKDDFAEIMLRDTGEGIPEEHLQKIFEPLFTKKAKGIGLGLAIVKGIVEGHKGKIKVESEVGEGTTFTIKLPLQRIEEKGG